MPCSSTPIPLNLLSLISFATKTGRLSSPLFSSVLRSLASGPAPALALQLLNLILQSPVRPDPEFLLPFAFRAAARSSAGPVPARSLHALAFRLALNTHTHVGTSLVHTYAGFQLFDDACKVFDEMTVRTVVTYNAVISSCGKFGWDYEGFGFFNRLLNDDGVQPNEDSFVGVVSCCANSGLVVNGRAVHALALKLLRCIGMELWTCLVHMYCKCGCLEYGKKAFDRTGRRDASMWTAMIGGLAMHGLGEDAVGLFRRMVADGVRPDSKAFTAVLHACSHSGLLEIGIEIFNEMKSVYMVVPREEHYGVMVDLLSRAGRISDAEEIIKSMLFEPNQIIVGALLNGCMNNKESESGDQLRQQQLVAAQYSEGREEGGFLVGMSNVYAKSGSWDNVRGLRDKMVEKGVKKEKGLSLIEVNGKVHRFLVGDTRHQLTVEIYKLLSALDKALLVDWL